MTALDHEGGYREEAIHLEVVGPSVRRCEDCRHSTPILETYYNGYPPKFLYLACKVRAYETLKPFEPPESLDGCWDTWSCEEFNSEGFCERWETKVWRSRLWDWFRWHVMRVQRDDN